jgi:hypothetical protein
VKKGRKKKDKLIIYSPPPRKGPQAFFRVLEIRIENNSENIFTSFVVPRMNELNVDLSNFDAVLIYISVLVGSSAALPPSLCVSQFSPYSISSL